MAHTPGPWRVVQGDRCLHTISEDSRFSTGCISFDGNGPANAHLVAAAPDLLAACKHFVESWTPMDADEQASMDMARAAIAKAEGQLEHADG